MTSTPSANPSGSQSNTGLTSLASKDFNPIRVTPITDKMIPKQWPEELTTRYPDYVEFLAYKYVSYADYYTSVGIGVSSSSTNATPSAGTSSSTQTKPATGNAPNGSSAATTNVSVDFAGKPQASTRFIRGNPLDQIKLPVPSTIQFADGPNWSTEPIGIMGTQLGAVVKSLEGGQDAQVATNLKKMAEGLQSEIALKAIAGTGRFGSAEAITQGIGGKIQNPYTEQIFKGIEPRSFSFNWRLVPRNRTEQDKINDLIKAFRYNSLPNYSSELSTDDVGSNDNLSDRWLTVPSVWNIRFFSGGSEMKYIPLLKVCVIKNISVNFTPDNVWATHMVDKNQPAPVAYDLQLEFQEVEIITSDEVKKLNY